MHRSTVIGLCLLSTVLFLPVLLSGCSSDDPSSSNSSAFINPQAKPLPEPPAPLLSPVRIDSIDDNTLAVSDIVHDAIYLVEKSTLEPLESIPFAGEPTGIARIGNKYFVGNQQSKSIDVLNKKGKFLYYLGGRPVLFHQINDIAVDTARGRIYGLDTQAAVVKAFNFDGTSAGDDIGVGILEKPTALAVSPVDGSLLVSDFIDPGGGFRTKPAKVWIFDVDSSDPPLELIGGTATFSRPQGMYVSQSNHLFLVDALAGEVQVFDLATQELVKTLGEIGTDPGELFYPLDVVVDESTQDVFVADNRNRRITVFAGGGGLP